MEERTRTVRKTRVLEKRNIPVPDHVNCRCVPTSMKATDFFNRFAAEIYTPARILKSGPVTVVFWVDGTKTVVRPAPGVVPCDYDAFTSALAIKIYGNNSRLKKLIRAKTVEQKPKDEKPKAKEPKAEEPADGAVQRQTVKKPKFKKPVDDAPEEPEQAGEDE